MLEYHIYIKGIRLKSKTGISVDHNVKLYSNDMIYQKENKLMGEKYFDYIDQYSLSHDNFLELGIGFGETIQLINNKYTNIVVLDAEQKLINKYSPIYTDITFIHTYFEDFNTKEKFDNIGMGFVIDLVKNPVQLLKKYANLLTKNGKIYISVGSASSLHLNIALNAGLIDNVKKMCDIKKGFNYQSFYTYDELINLFEEADLNLVDVHGLMIKPFSTMQIDSLKLDDKIYNALAETARDLPEISNACFFVLENK